MIRFFNTKRPALKLIIASLIFLSACEGTPKKQLTIATAANMQFAMKELAQTFTNATGIACQPVISSSGKLTAQIKEGAPFDLLVSADLKYPETLHQDGFTLEPPKVYAYGKLVLWTYQGERQPQLDQLADQKVKHIALANPKTAPYGQAAVEVLTRKRIYQDVESRLVFGESIAQTNQFITSGAAEYGFTAKSVVLSPQMLDKGRWLEIEDGQYQPIRQGVVLLKQSHEPELARRFYEFLFSAEAKTILERYGYSVP